MGKGKGKSKCKGNAEAKAEQEAKFKANQVAKNVKHIEDTDRVTTEVETTGVFKRRIGSRGWIVLDWPEDLNDTLRTKLDEMCANNRIKIRTEGKQDRLFSSHVVFMHDFEMQKDHEPPDEGDELKFKLYTDNLGVGAYDIEIQKKAKPQRWSRSVRRRKY